MYLFHFRFLLLFLVYTGTILVRHFPLIYVVHFTDIGCKRLSCHVSYMYSNFANSGQPLVIGSMVSS